MPILNYDVEEAGLIIPVVITGMPPDPQNQEEQPKMEGKALIDTGASHTSIKIGVAKQLGLEPIGRTPVITPNAEGYYLTYSVMIITDAGAITTEVTELPISNQPAFNCIIGRNVLELGTLFYNGRRKQFTLSF